MLYFDPRPGPKMLFQGDTPEGSDTFQWPVIERDRVGGLRLMIWDKVKVPLCHYRVTSELHDSYFRLMTIKHSISKIQWAIVWTLNYYIIELSSGCQSSCQQTSRELETRCGREGHTRPRGPSETPEAVASRIPDSQRPDVVGKATPDRGGPRKAPMELTPTSGEQERHNVTVITVGSKYEVYVRSPAPSHMQTLNNPFEPLQ